MNITQNFKENLAQLPDVSHLECIALHDASGTQTGLIENKPGQQGSLAVYHYLAQTLGAEIGAASAARALALFAEHTTDARANPGKHPNIDRLLVIEAGGAALTLKLVPARG